MTVYFPGRLWPSLRRGSLYNASRTCACRSPVCGRNQNEQLQEYLALLYRVYRDSSISSELPTIHELAEFAETRPFSVAAESPCLKRGNHFVENALSKASIKRSVTLQPSEEQGTAKGIDQQLWIGRRLQFAGCDSVFNDAALDLTSLLDISLQKHLVESVVLVDTGKDACHDRTLFRDEELTRTQDVAAEARQRGAGLWNRENRFHVFKARVEQDFFLRLPPAV